MSSAELAARLSGRRGALALDVVFTAPSGQVTALVGPSGAGKSTLLRALAGLERLEGEVTLGGEVWQSRRRFVPPHRRGVGLVFQNSALFSHLSVAGNLRFAARRSGAAPGEVSAAVDLLALAPLLERGPDRLSGGERRRVALGRALLARPRLLLLDEPLSGLDEEARAALLPQLQAVFAGLSIPILYVSHDRAEVAHLGRRVLRLGAGRLTLHDAPAANDPLLGLSPEQVRALARRALSAGLHAAP